MSELLLEPDDTLIWSACVFLTELSLPVRNLYVHKINKAEHPLAEVWKHLTVVRILDQSHVHFFKNTEF